MRITVTAALVLALAAPGGAQQARPRDETGILPEGWSIEAEVRQLEVSTKDFGAVIRSLGSANSELQELLTKHLKNPDDRVTSSLLEKKLAAYGAEATRDFDRIISTQDSTVSNFRSLNRKLARFNSYLLAKIEATQANADVVRKDVDKMESELQELAAQVKHASNAAEEREARQKFNRLYQRYRLQKRYADGYARNHEGYKKLSEQLVQLNGLFGTLKDKFTTLIGGLETERMFLLDNMNLQEDSMKVKVLLRDGVISGREAIGKITEKMAALFLKVDAFNKITDRISTNMDTFNDFQAQMAGVSEKLQAVGILGDAKSMDDVIDAFYRRRFGDEAKEVKNGSGK